MFLTLRQIRRTKSRSALLAGVIALLLFLILILQAFKTALVTLFVGAIENQSAPVLVYDVDARRSIADSTISEPVEALVRQVDGAQQVGRLGVALVPVSVRGAQTVATIIGFDRQDAGGPTKVVAGRLPAAPGEAVASNDNFRVGDTVSVLPGPLTLQIVGLTADSYLFASGVFTSYDTYLDAVKAANPTAAMPRPNALAVVPRAGVGEVELIERINAVGPEVDALTRSAAANRNPGVRSVSGLFNSLLPVFAVVVPLVSGVFFVIITVQQAASLTLLSALGASRRRLVESLLGQAGLMLGAGLGTGVFAFFVVTRVSVAGVALPFGVVEVAWWALGLFAAGLASAGFAARQVLRLDPAGAVGGGGLGR